MRKVNTTHFNLLNSQIQEGVLVPHTDQTLRAFAAHAGAQAAIELHYYQLVQHRRHVIRQASGLYLFIGLNLKENIKLEMSTE